MAFETLWIIGINLWILMHRVANDQNADHGQKQGIPMKRVNAPVLPIWSDRDRFVFGKDLLKVPRDPRTLRGLLPSLHGGIVA